MSFGYKIYLSKYPGSSSFRIYMVIGVYIQNPRRMKHLQEGDALGRSPMEMKYTYPSTPSHVVSENIWLWGSISKALGVVACFFLHLQEGDALWK